MAYRQRTASTVGIRDNGMSKTTVRRIAALERAYEGRDDVVVLGKTPWQDLQPKPPLSFDQWTALAVPQQAALIRDNHP